MKRAIIYARVSTRDQETENQVSQLRDYASAQEWRVVEVVIDVASGGKDKKDRSGLSEVFSRGHRKRFDILLFWSLDRLSREGSRQTIGYLTQLESYGIDWHSYTEPYISSLGIFSDAIISLLAALARQERVRISERTKAGLERTRRVNGTRLGRRKTPKEKFIKAMKLRDDGLSFSQIGKQMGVTGPRAFQLVKQGKEELVKDDGE